MIKIKNFGKPDPQALHIFSFEQLRSIKELKCGISVYDKTSFPQNHDEERVEIPRKAAIIIVDNLRIDLGKNFGVKDLGKQVILTVHGNLTAGNWKESFEEQRDIEELLKALESEAFQIDALGICNDSDYELKSVQRDYTYLRGASLRMNGEYRLVNGELTASWQSAKRDGIFHIKGEKVEYIVE